MKSVGIAAMEMVKEVKDNLIPSQDCLKVLQVMRLPDPRQVHQNLHGREFKRNGPASMPCHGCADHPGTLFGVEAVVGLLAGGLASVCSSPSSASNTGGAWDNAKKYVVACTLTYRSVRAQRRSRGRTVYGGDFRNMDGSMIMISERQRKGSECHKAAVVGDTVGDPMRIPADRH